MAADHKILAVPEHVKKEAFKVTEHLSPLECAQVRGAGGTGCSAAPLQRPADLPSRRSTSCAPERPANQAANQAAPGHPAACRPQLTRPTALDTRPRQH